MSTRRVEVKIFVVHWIHDDCGGEFLPDGYVGMSNPPMYRHQCAKCLQVEFTRDGAYPLTQYEEVP